MPHRLCKALFVMALYFMPLGLSAFASVYYVATNGVDTNPGTSNSPFATIMKAQSAATSGDTVYLRGGTYHLDNSNLTATNLPWAIVNNLSKSGISYVADSGGRPVFDFSSVKPDGCRVTAFLVTASRCVFKGFDVVGVQVTIAGAHTQSENFRIAGGGFNRFEELRMHDGMGNGWYLTDGASNLVLNCDAYNNRGLDSGSLGNTDGFGCHPSRPSGKGNLFIGCRAWFNSDDGYDCINAWAPVTFSNCWAFHNGYFTNFVSSTGDGNGFKAGGYGKSGKPMPNPAPRHTVEFCLAVENRANGFYANHHGGGINWFNNTAFRNATDYNMICGSSDNRTDIPGFDQVMKNNLGFMAKNTEVANLGVSNDVTFNFFTLPVTVASNDFVSLDERLLMAPRQANGDLPHTAFAQLADGSDFADAGTNVGFAYVGAAPDLGAFEHGFKSAVGDGLQAGTNYPVTTTNLALPQMR
jgi:pectate lyase